MQAYANSCLHSRIYLVHVIFHGKNVYHKLLDIRNHFFYIACSYDIRSLPWISSKIVRPYAVLWCIFWLHSWLHSIFGVLWLCLGFCHLIALVCLFSVTHPTDVQSRSKVGCTTLLLLRSQCLRAKCVFGDMLPGYSAVSYCCAPPLQH